MRELQANIQVVGPAEVALVSFHEQGAQGLDLAKIGIVDQELVGIGAAVLAHRDRLAAPDHLGTTEAEVFPTATRQIRWLTVLTAIPTFHGQDREPIANRSPPPLVRSRQRSIRAVLDLGVEFEFSGDPEPFQNFL